jgi:hypothetical protein
MIAKKHIKKIMLIVYGLLLNCGFVFGGVQEEESIASKVPSFMAISGTFTEEGVTADDPGLTKWYSKMEKKGAPVNEIRASIQKELEHVKVVIIANFDPESKRWVGQPEIRLLNHSPVKYAYPLLEGEKSGTLTASMALEVSTYSLEQICRNDSECSAKFTLDIVINFETREDYTGGREIFSGAGGSWEMEDIELKVIAPKRIFQKRTH